MKVFHVIFENKEDSFTRIYADVIANNTKEVFEEAELNWEDYRIVSIISSAGDIIVVVGGKIEMYGCNEPPK